MKFSMTIRGWLLTFTHHVLLQPSSRARTSCTTSMLASRAHATSTSGWRPGDDEWYEEEEEEEEEEGGRGGGGRSTDLKKSHVKMKRAL